jgi:hypothetical protein
MLVVNAHAIVFEYRGAVRARRRRSALEASRLEVDIGKNTRTTRNQARTVDKRKLLMHFSGAGRG